MLKPAANPVPNVKDIEPVEATTMLEIFTELTTLSLLFGLVTFTSVAVVSNVRPPLAVAVMLTGEE